MKKVIFALLGATAMALIPSSVNAMTQKNYDDGECVITVENNETANIGSTNCRIKVKQGGVLNINGATIQKLTTFNGVDDEVGKLNDAAILNLGGTVNVKNGLVYARYGYGIISHNGGTVNVSGGTVHSVLHQAIHSDSDTINISGGNVKGAIGGEEAVHTYGKLNITGGAINGTPVNQQAKADETITITVTTSEKKTEAAPAQKAEPAKTVAKTTPIVKTPETDNKNTEEKAETEASTIDKTIKNEKKSDKKAETKEETTEADAETEQTDDSNIMTIAITAIALAIGGAATAITINRLRH